MIERSISRRTVLTIGAVSAFAPTVAPGLFSAGGAAAADADALDRLIGLIGDRLTVMPDVARNKYNSGAAVEDLPREAQVLAAVAAQAERAGVTRALAESFFQAQIDAAKMLQQARIDAWTAEKRPPFADVPDLALDIRPKLDALTPGLIAALLEAGPLLNAPQTKRRLEKAAVGYAVVHPQDAAAFRRALAPLGLNG